MTTPEDSLARAENHLGRAVDALEEAKDQVPAYSLSSLRFLRAELKLVIRRVQNVRRVVGGSTDLPPVA